MTKKLLITATVLAGVIVMIALRETGWQTHNAFFTGMLIMLSPGILLATLRLWERKENIKNHYYMAENVFRARRLLKKEEKEARKK